ncbi:MAG: FtsX-like permease family protein [Alphaproteobacteria bacterium]|nr:FtsX-like permease family protein [Alphaproteobacteria bacterium]
MPFRVAWRILTHQIGRTVLASIGIFIAVLLVFVELGFFVAVPQGGMLVYDHMRFDLLLVSDTYVYQANSGTFPRARLDTVAKVAQVAQVSPIYFGAAKWQDPNGGTRLDVSVLGIDPRARDFAVSDIEEQTATLEQRDTVLVDSTTRPLFGPLTPGRVVDIDGHRVTLAGSYVLGTGFLGLGVALASEANFFRLFPLRPRDSVNLGLIEVKPGIALDAAESAIKSALPAGMRVFTRDELSAHEVAYWTTRTATGLIFGSGLIVSIIVGVMVLYQTLATQISRQLPQFATLKAIGYSDRYLDAIVLIESLLMMLVAFVPAMIAALGVYSLVRKQTLLPLDLTPSEFGIVFAASLAMASVSAVLSLSALRRADPAEVF